MKIQRIRNILLSSVLSLALGSLIVGCEGTSRPIEQTTDKKEESRTSNNIVLSQQKEEVIIQKKEVVTQKEEITIQKEEVYKKKKNIPLSTEPTNYRKFALVANGKITVKNKLTTDGPLADIHANGTIDAVTRSLNISGKIVSKNRLTDAITRSFEYNSNTPQEDFVTIRALKVSEYMNLNSISQYYSLKSDGKIEKVNENGTEEIFSLEEADVTYSNGTWTLSGGNIKIFDNLKVEGNLNIKADSTSIAGTLMISGDLISEGELNINTGIPFNSALVVNKNIVVDKLVTIGRVHSSGNFTANGIVNIIGNAEIDGDVVLYDDTKINMLDNVYKAALADEQEDNEKVGTTSMLVHSQLFKNLKGKNSVVLFTFVEGNYLIDENTLNSLIDSNNTKDFQFKTSLYGASIDYSSQLFKANSLSDYYQNLKIVKKALKEQFGEVVVKKYIDIAPLRFYCQFEDQNGNDIGTYLVSDIANTDVSQLLKLTEEEITKEIETLENPTQAEEKRIQEIKDAKPEDSNETMLSIPDDVNESMREEITSQQNLIETEISSIDKIALEGENEVARINEWVQYQELGVENEIVEVEKVIINNDDLNSSAEQRGWWSKAKKKATKVGKKIFKVATLTDCRKKYSHDEISGVDASTTAMTDKWGREVSLWNGPADYCTPTAAASVMQYNVHIRRNKPSLYNSQNDHESGTNPYVTKWAGFLHTKRKGGTTAWHTFWQLPYRMYHEHRNNKMFGWAYSYYTAVINRAWQFRIMKQYIKRNRPGIYHAPKGTVSGVNEDHSMPVIGWKTESYSGICAKRIWPNKNWFLVDTESDEKAYVRFDSRSNYWRIGAISYIWSR